MMTGLTPEVTKSVDAITSETATTKTASSLRSVRFWRAFQIGESPNDFLARAGFDIEFKEDADKKVQEVTLRLNKSWLSILHRVLERQKA